MVAHTDTTKLAKPLVSVVMCKPQVAAPPFQEAVPGVKVRLLAVVLAAVTAEPQVQAVASTTAVAVLADILVLVGAGASMRAVLLPCRVMPVQVAVAAAAVQTTTTAVVVLAVAVQVVSGYSAKAQTVVRVALTAVQVVVARVVKTVKLAAT